MAFNGVGELEIQHAILELMKDRRIWTNANLKNKLKETLPWTDEDRSRSISRPTEWVWENRINNALSPSRKSSLYGKEQVEDCGRGMHRITDLGYKFITDSFSDDELMGLAGL